MTTTQPHAILLLGPTGSGKTPLGEYLTAHGLWGRPCFHFDFGRQLRDAAASARPPANLSADDVAFLRGVLERGALLENEHFPIAEKILRAFLEGKMGTDLQDPQGLRRLCPSSPAPPRRAKGTDDNGDRHLRCASEPVPIIVLNGLPRHVDQARDLERIVDVRTVVFLSCRPEVVLRRIDSNAGGDRAGRSDDAEAAVRARLELFARRTGPLVEYYRRRSAAIRTIEVALATTPREIRLALEAAP